jgi:hypothetical protein
MSRPEGATATAMVNRQRIVCSLLIKGMSATEIARQVRVRTLRTIERDIEEIRANFTNTTQTEQIRNLALADAEFGELWRESWILYHRTSQEDSGASRLAILDRLTRIAAERNRLFFNITNSLNPSPQKPSYDEAVAQVINLLPVNDRKRAVVAIEERIETLERSS